MRTELHQSASLHVPSSGASAPSAGSTAWHVLSVLERWVWQDAEHKGADQLLAPKPWTKQVVRGALPKQVGG